MRRSRPSSIVQQIAARPFSVSLRLGQALAALILSQPGCNDYQPRAWNDPIAQEVPGGDAARGRAAIDRYGCGSCHTIPGIRRAVGMAGAPLDHWSRRGYIAGALPNTPEHLIAWIVNPQAIEPGTVMPNLGVSAAEAADIAAYLYTLR